MRNDLVGGINSFMKTAIHKDLPAIPKFLPKPPGPNLNLNLNFGGKITSHEFSL